MVGGVEQQGKANGLQTSPDYGPKIAASQRPSSESSDGLQTFEQMLANG